MPSVINSDKDRTRHKITHQLMAFGRAQTVLGAVKDQGGNVNAAQCLALVGPRLKRP